MKLLFVVNDTGFFLSHRLPIAIAALKQGYEVHIAAPQDDRVPGIIDYGFFFHPISMTRRGVHPLEPVRTVLNLCRLYQRIRPDIVHHVTIKPILYGGLAARIADVPAVVNALTGLGYVFLAQGWKAAIRRRGVGVLYRFALSHSNSRVIFQNPDDCNLFVNAGFVRPERAIVIKGSGVDMTNFLPAPEPDGKPLVIFAARMLWDKGVKEFVEAAKQLHGEGLIARFALVGDTDSGNPAAVSREQLVRWKNEGHVEWWGQRENMVEVFAQCHLVCLPSYGEGVPKVLIEAAACGRAIVTTNTPGCREIVRDHQNGLLVPVRDVAALANAMRELIQDPVLRIRMGARGRQLAETEFDLKSVVAKTLDIYRKLLPSPGHGDSRQ
jgi:glycosyltransferase involved in cell wall biosynthesis